MTIKIHPIKAFSDNYIWTLHDNKHAVVVDPGDSQVVEQYLSEQQLSLVAILITHHHYDHVDGLESLQRQWQCPVYAPKDNRIPGHTTPVTHGDTVTIAALSLKFHVLFTPGHTVSHICYHDGDKLFCGDTLFSLGCGRMFEGTAEQFHDSLSLLKGLDDETKVYCTHEYTEANWRFAFEVMTNKEALQDYKHKIDALRQAGLPTIPSTIATEKMLNPFLNCGNGSLTTTLENKFNHPIRSDTQAFGLLRQWKDNF